MNFSRINNITGWIVFALSLVVYLLTMAPTASYWDCGEFIACANELEVPHPPGAPFFLILGRVFAMFAGSPERVSVMLNLLSALSSAFTVLFTFWIVTHLGKRLLSKEGETFSIQETIVIIASGVVGGLVCAFADSFWFNAVEAEVYAMSSFFTAIVVWLMFKWEERAEEPGNEKWIILIAYLMGLSIGVHLLNLLAIPALAFIYFFRKYPFSWQGFITVGLISIVILGIIQTGIILYTFDIAWSFERFFAGTVFSNGAEKGGLGLPLGSGIIFWFILLFGALAYLIYWSSKHKKHWLNVSALSAAVIYIGFSSYAMVPIRSNADPAIDENNPDNSYTFLKYMQREQYGERPLLYGPLYNAQPIDYEDAGMEYVLDEGADKYRELGIKRRYKYRDTDKKLFPRMYYDQQDRWRSGPHAYVNYVKRKGDPNRRDDDKPTPGEDFRFFLDYQVGHMYWRYFLWNFVGRQGDEQDMDWESGINFSQKAAMPAPVKNDKGKNHYFFLPLLLGLLGIYWQSSKKGNDAIIIGLLFFFTGLAIIIYLNQYPQQPRERDYSFAGSFQTFAIWVGLGVIGLYELSRKFLKQAAVGLATLVGITAPTLMLIYNWDDHTRAKNYLAPDSAYNLLESLAPNAILFTNGDNDTFPLWYIQEVENVRPDVRVLCLSYVNTDWYIDQMYQDINESPALPLTLKKEQYVGQANQGWDMKTNTKIRYKLPVNPEQLLQDGMISEAEQKFVSNTMEWDVPTRGGSQMRYLELKDKVILNLLENISRDGWNRPVYFANTVTRSSFLGLTPYLRLEGMAYRITPVKNPMPNDPFSFYVGGIQPELMFENLTNKFKYRELDNPSVYYDENARRTVMNYHSVFYQLANYYHLEIEKLQKAATASPDSQTVVLRDLELTGITSIQQQIDLLKEKAMGLMKFQEEKMPFNVVDAGPFIKIRHGIMYDRLGEKAKAEELFNSTKQECIDLLKYYQRDDAASPGEEAISQALLMLYQHLSIQGEQEKAKALMEELEGHKINIL